MTMSGARGQARPRSVIEVNGTPCEVSGDPLRPLVSVLRDELGLTGTKIGCSAGDCGACTVLLDQVPVASCLLPAVRADGRSVTTIEGLGGAERSHPLQEAFRTGNASQCGYCIPGILLAATELLERAELGRQDVVDGLTGNLCRCTGYDTIIDAVLAAHAMRAEATGEARPTGGEADRGAR
jgi:aerobic-type carbon monoxide dehydrogenase small subunit (CoxS/CutS family)